MSTVLKLEDLLFTYCRYLRNQNYSNLYNKHKLLVDASGSPVTQLVISVTDASGNSVTG